MIHSWSLKRFHCLSRRITHQKVCSSKDKLQVLMCNLLHSYYQMKITQHLLGSGYKGRLYTITKNGFISSPVEDPAVILNALFYRSHMSSQKINGPELSSSLFTATLVFHHFIDFTLPCFFTITHYPALVFFMWIYPISLYITVTIV